MPALQSRLMHLAWLLATLPVLAQGQQPAFDSLNAVRAQGCGGKPGIALPFVRNADLDRGALAMSRGATLREAMAQLEHRLQHATSIVIRNASSEASRRDVLKNQFCADVLDRTLTHVGVVERDRDAWMILGAPFETPSAANTSAMNQRVLELINEARSQKRRCGSKRYQPAAPLKRDAQLDKAALRHARDMAAHSFLGHDGTDGTRVAQRATDAGYAWRKVGENVAAGSPTPEQAVEDWLESPGHCANLMTSDYTETGIAVIVNPASKAGIYWAQVFALPR
jgi:uncharacterized protein YkwD